MKTKFFYLSTLIFIALISSKGAYSQSVSVNEAFTIANNWIRIINDRYGGWGDYKNAQPRTVEEIIQEGKLLGYYCAVDPEGFIIMYPEKYLFPIKAYNESGTLDMNAEGGMAVMIKDRMEKVIDMNQNVSSGKVSEAWQFVYSYIPGSIGPSDNYQEGEVMLTSLWHQNAPYNNYCPDSSCTTTTNGNCKVGCVATAGAQLMRYWQWPPQTDWMNNQVYNFDWEYMKDDVTTSDPEVEQNAVAYICLAVGLSVDMDYGCSGSGALTASMKDSYKDYFYYSTDCDFRFRNLYSNSDWYDIMIDQFMQNRPIQYDVDGHSIVADGWREVNNDFEFHMNYGWGGSSNAWYILDSIPLSIPDEEDMIINIVPENNLGTSLAGIYTSTFSHRRYFDRDATGSYAAFWANQKLQFLKGTKVKSTGTISFEGGDYPVILYSDYMEYVYVYGIKVNNNGKVVLHNGGMIKFPE
jgi:hypothetical protein